MDDWGECAWTARDLLGEPSAALPLPEVAVSDVERFLAREITTEDLVMLLRDRVAREGEDVIRRYIEAPRLRRRERYAITVKSFLAGAVACVFLLAGSGYPSSERPALDDAAEPPPAASSPWARLPADRYPPP